MSTVPTTSPAPLVWSDAETWDPEHTMPDGYFIRADQYTICRIGSKCTTSTRTAWRFEVWRGTEQLRVDFASLPDARRFAERHHKAHGHEPVAHDRTP